MSEADELKGMIVRLYDRLSEMAARWDQAVYDHDLRVGFGDYEDEPDAVKNRKVLFENRPLADWESLK